MNTNNQSDDDSRSSDTVDDNRKRAKKGQDCPGVIVVLTYASKKAAQCMRTDTTFAPQLYVVEPTSLRLFGGLVTDQLSNDFIEKL